MDAVEPKPLLLRDCAHNEAFWSVPSEEVAHLVPAPLRPVNENGLAGFFVTGLDCRTSVQGLAGVLWMGVEVHAPEGFAPAEQFNGYLIGSYHSTVSSALVFGDHMPNVVQQNIQFTHVTHEDQGVGLVRAPQLRLSTVAPAELMQVEQLHARFWTTAGGQVSGALELWAREHDVVAGASAVIIDDVLWGMEQPTPVVPVGWQGDIAEAEFIWKPAGDLREGSA